MCVGSIGLAGTLYHHSVVMGDGSGAGLGARCSSKDIGVGQAGTMHSPGTLLGGDGQKGHIF